MVNERAGIAVALLSGTREFGVQLREALTALGAPIVYEAPPAALDRSALERSHANVVVVNLDAQNDPDLDEIYSLLDDERYRVVFNEGNVSNGLSGWDHARWMRHLAAKVLGDADIDPPRPVGAEAVPARPTPAVVPQSPEALKAVADIEPAPTAVTAPPFAFSLEPVAPTADTHTIEAAPVVARADDHLHDLDALIEIPDVAPPPSPGHLDELQALLAEPVPMSLDAASIDTLEISGFDDLAVPPAPAVEATSAGKQALAADAFDFDDIDASALDFEAVAAPEGTEAFDLADESALDFDLDFEAGQLGADIPVAPGIAAAEPAPPAAIAAPDEWSLEDMLDAPPPSSSADAARPQDFGIEKLRAEEFLAPTAGTTMPPPVMADSGLTLELIPLEEAVAPTSIETSTEAWLDPEVQTAKVRRVWVLGASIGGPEAVREFLAALPRDYPALFLLAQHLGDEFVDMMTRQLAQVTQMTVRTPTHGERVGHGEIIVVPTAQRLRVDAQGVVVLERISEESTYRPSIDRVLRDVADRFGTNAGAIVFSGMGEDAIEGCRYLEAKGGLVYAQQPDTCVVSTMIDGVCDTGVVTFLGSPQELAEKLLADR